jgi:hypothetical protein
VRVAWKQQPVLEPDRGRQTQLQGARHTPATRPPTHFREALWLTQQLGELTVGLPRNDHDHVACPPSQS